MCFEPVRMPIDLEKAVPTKMTVPLLKKQLDAIGLTCDEADPDLLETYIKEVREEFPNGRVQCFDVRHDDGSAVPTQQKGEPTRGNWLAPKPYEYTRELACIQKPENFDWLLANNLGFLGRKVNPPQYSGRSPTADVIKGMFSDVANVISASLNNGIDREAVEAALSTAITPLDDPDAVDYEPGPATRVLLLVDKYNEDKKEASGVGILNVEWTLYIKNYKKKKEIGVLHKWTLDVTVRAVLYSQEKYLLADYAAICGKVVKSATPRMSNKLVSALNIEPLDFEPEPREVEIFDKLPEANKASWKKGILLEARSDYSDVVILYGAGLENIGSIDNSASPASSTWSRSVSKGFTFEAAQHIESTASFEASAIVVTASLSVTLAFSFTESWNTTTTETIEFTVPAGEIAFTYQGYTMSRILRYTPSGDSYSYRDKGRCLSPSIVTSPTPLEYE